MLFQHPPRRSAGAEAETGTEKSARCTACHKGGWTADWLVRYSNAKQVDAIAAELFCCEEAKWSQAKAKEKSLVIKRCSDPSSRFGIVARILATVVQWLSMTCVAGQLLHPRVQHSELPQSGGIEKSGYVFLVGFGHSGLLFEGLDFSDYRTNASELEMAHLQMMLSSGGTGARLALMLPSRCPSCSCHPSKQRCEHLHGPEPLDFPELVGSSPHRLCVLRQPRRRCVP